MTNKKNILYCHCKYARVVDQDVKDAVLDGLASSGAAFHAAPDLCEMASRRDPLMDQRAKAGDLQIIACYPRAVKALFQQAEFDYPEDIKIHNMRDQSPEEILETVGVSQTSAAGSSSE